MSAVPAPRRTSWSRLVIVGVALAAFVGILVIAFLWPAVTASVEKLPVALVGDEAQTSQVEKAFEQKAPGTFAFTIADDRDAAVKLIETRTTYGAIVLGNKPEVLTASAASPVVSQILGSLAPALQGQLNAAVAARGVKLLAPITVAVTDVVPLAAGDARGSVIAASSFPLLLGGMLLGGIVLSAAVVGVWRRVAAILVFSVAGGLGLAGILQGWFGALQGDYFTTSGAIALALLSIGGFVVGCVSLIGRAGWGIGSAIFLLIANPLSAAAQPVEFLAAPWGAVGQWFPPGAAATLLRQLSYFPNANSTFPWLVLIGWSALGLVLAAGGRFKDRGAASRLAIE
ncbi:MAG: ABC transporter permease [Lacisediminihabitans sp.]